MFVDIIADKIREVYGCDISKAGESVAVIDLTPAELDQYCTGPLAENSLRDLWCQLHHRADKTGEPVMIQPKLQLYRVLKVYPEAKLYLNVQEASNGYRVVAVLPALDRDELQRRSMKFYTEHQPSLMCT